MPATLQYSEFLGSSTMNHIEFDLTGGETVNIALTPNNANTKVSLRHVFLEANNNLNTAFAIGSNVLVNIPSTMLAVSLPFDARITQAVGSTLTITPTGTGNVKGWASVEVHH